MFRNIKTITKIKFIIFLIFISLFIISCDDNSSRYQIDPTDLDWNIFEINQVNYDSLIIKSQDSIKLDEQLVTKIIFYEIEKFEHIIIDSLVPTYIIAKEGYFINFEFNKDVKLSKLYFDFAIRFYFENGSFVEIEKNHFMLSYPYDSVKILFDANTICDNQEYHNVQDFDFVDNVLYFHPYGAFGLYEFNKYGENIELVEYDGGDYIASDLNFVFIDWRHGLIKRYNTQLDTIDLSFDFSNLEYSQINGLECWNNNLYVMFDNEPNNFIAVFDYNGSYIKSIPYSRANYHLTIDDGIAYSRDLNNEINRFDLNTGIFLENKPMPTAEGEAIHIDDGFLFFIAYYKNLICYLPLSQLE